MTAMFPKKYPQYVTDMIVWLVQDGIPLKEAKKIAYELTLEQKKVMK